MKARVYVTLKNGVLDPQGKAIAHAVHSLGIDGVSDVRQGKVIDIEFSETDPERVKTMLERMCNELLANTVIENYRYELDSA